MNRAPAIPLTRSIARRLLTLAVLTAAIAVLAAGGSASAGASSRSGTNVTVSIEDFFFNPTPITVHVGDTVTWANNGANYHSATARNGSFDTDPFAPGETRYVTFNKVGTYAYYCEIHPFMHGKVKVRS